MLTHRTLADITAALYGDISGTPPVDWLYRSNPDANVYMGIVEMEGHLVVCCRGSFNFQDWWHDVIAPPIDPAGQPAIKEVHTGFYSGTPEAWDIVCGWRELFPHDLLIFCGHSLGAARAILLAAWAQATGTQPGFVCCWGEPAPLYPIGNELLKDVPGVSYCNQVDMIVDPVTLSTLPFGYEHRLPLTNVSARPTQTIWAPTDLHSFLLYQSATPLTPIA